MRTILITVTVCLVTMLLAALTWKVGMFAYRYFRPFGFNFRPLDDTDQPNENDTRDSEAGGAGGVTTTTSTATTATTSTTTTAATDPTGMISSVAPMTSSLSSHTYGAFLNPLTTPPPILKPAPFVVPLSDDDDEFGPTAPLASPQQAAVAALNPLHAETRDSRQTGAIPKATGTSTSTRQIPSRTSQSVPARSSLPKYQSISALIYGEPTEEEKFLLSPLVDRRSNNDDIYGQSPRLQKLKQLLEETKSSVKEKIKSTLDKK